MSVKNTVDESNDMYYCFSFNIMCPPGFVQVFFLAHLSIVSNGSKYGAFNCSLPRLMLVEQRNSKTKPNIFRH